MALHINVYRILTDKVLFSLRNLTSSLYRYHLSLVVVVIEEVKIVYRLFLVNCYLLHVPRLPLQLASSGRG